MRLRHDPAAAAFVAAHPMVLEEKDALTQRGHWAALFGNDAPLCLEVGMGRGRFLAAAAAADAARNYIGLELHEEMILQALQRLPQDAALSNLRFVHANAALLPELFAPAELRCIYLHFPDPWPKARHAKRRLTAPQFLVSYHALLCPGGELRFKTDNAALFAWSLAHFAASAFEVVETADNLPEARAGVMTEYELRYRRQGVPIHFLRAVKRPVAEGEAAKRRIGPS